MYNKSSLKFIPGFILSEKTSIKINYSEGICSALYFR